MKQILAILISLLFVLHIRAQQMVSVIDDDTRKPVGRAFFIQSGDTIAYTSPEGIALVSKKPGKVIVTAKDYKPLELNVDSLPAVIRIRCEVESLEEIVVIGDKNKRKPKKFKLESKDARTLVPKAGGGIGISIDAIFRAFGYRPASEKRHERVKKKLDAYDKIKPTQSLPNGE